MIIISEKLIEKNKKMIVSIFCLCSDKQCLVREITRSGLRLKTRN